MSDWKKVRLDFALKKSLKTKEHAPMPSECKRTSGEYFGFMEAWDIAVQNDPRVKALIEALRFYSTPETFETHMYGIDGTHPGDSYIKGYEFDDYTLNTVDGHLVKEQGRRAREALKAFEGSGE